MTHSESDNNRRIAARTCPYRKSDAADRRPRIGCAMGDLCRLIWSIVGGLFRSRPALHAEILVLRLSSILKPETVVRWHRAGFRAYWRWKSRLRGGRPRTSP